MCSVIFMPRSFITIAISHFSLLTIGLFHRVSCTSLANRFRFQEEGNVVFANPLIQTHSVTDGNKTSSYSLYHLWVCNKPSSQCLQEIYHFTLDPTFCGVDITFICSPYKLCMLICSVKFISRSFITIDNSQFPLMVWIVSYSKG